MGLNEESNDVAYVLGRLFSVLESIQMPACHLQLHLHNIPDGRSMHLNFALCCRNQYQCFVRY